MELTLSKHLIWSLFLLILITVTFGIWRGGPNRADQQVKSYCLNKIKIKLDVGKGQDMRNQDLHRI